MRNAMTGRALVAGGSIAGLFAAAALMRQGWDVRVFERSDVELAGRGAGIVTHDVLIDALAAVGAQTDDLGVQVERRVAFDIKGEQVAALEYPQIVTSWDRLHQLLRVLIPDAKYVLGKSVTGYAETQGGVSALFDDGTREEADVLVGADGFRSAIRAQMLPDIRPQYSGYVVWRAVTDESQFSPENRARVFTKFGVFAPNCGQILGYPIAGPGNDLREEKRRYNFVWYSAVSDDHLQEMLTDSDGHRHSVSIPPPRIRDAVLERMRDEAARNMPPLFFDILRRSERPFFTPIYDHCCPVFAKGRVVLTGDAACVARPHVGMGVTKAAQDAFALARCVSNGDLPAALNAYSEERVPASRRAYDRGQTLGSYIFDTDPRQNHDGRDNPNIHTILKDTAVPVL